MPKYRDDVFRAYCSECDDYVVLKIRVIDYETGLPRYGKDIFSCDHVHSCEIVKKAPGQCPVYLDYEI